MNIEWFDSPLNAMYTRESGLTDTSIWFEWGQYPEPVSGGGESVVFQVYVDDTATDTRLFGVEAVNHLKEIGILTPERIERIIRQYHGAAELFN